MWNQYGLGAARWEKTWSLACLWDEWELTWGLEVSGCKLAKYTLQKIFFESCISTAGVVVWFSWNGRWSLSVSDIFWSSQQRIPGSCPVNTANWKRKVGVDHCRCTGYIFACARFFGSLVTVEFLELLNVHDNISMYKSPVPTPKTPAPTQFPT